MRIYIHKSEVLDGLRAFSSDPEGSKLPSQFRPWHAIGVVRPDKDPPHKLPRAAIEKAIGEQGFQLWRLKAKPTAK